MNLQDMDLNLLVVFNELCKHGRVSAVAQNLGISQPGVSNALGRLRKLLGDELFLRTSRGMVRKMMSQSGELTPKARSSPAKWCRLWCFQIPPKKFFGGLKTWIA